MQKQRQEEQTGQFHFCSRHDSRSLCEQVPCACSVCYDCKSSTSPSSVGDDSSLPTTALLPRSCNSEQLCFHTISPSDFFFCYFWKVHAILRYFQVCFSHEHDADHARHKAGRHSSVLFLKTTSYHGTERLERELG